ncbi:probable WRKY transcription factor 53 [Olea europaea var. sylvestris]|uniref:Probable WRKY transcription factor 46 n=1 Tax=Olea europaea subsp. europaea TaxID=158383 RepID=A0A8S0QSS2_OLEEU|nr:probable WRKY transcription factor 53 [Olea europaea var. sylvestris]CAA2968650.1 probable WRKY transcription factor 46 [Olea europaea subsp. europaea]
MEKIGTLKRKTVISELTQGRELANQLKNQIYPANSREACGSLVEKILSSYEKALSLLNCMAVLGETSPVSAAILESRNSLVGTPTSEGSNPFSKEQNQREVFKRRKILPKWSEEVRVCSVIGQEGPPDDGYNWRKYGQKDILGASFPRAYYRCTHRHTQGCLATKQVQKIDEDPSTFEVNYRGRHTCIQERLKQNKEDYNIKEEDSNHRPGIKVETPDSTPKEEIVPSFSFPSTPIISDNVETEFLLEPAKESNFTESYGYPFISPATSDCNYLSESLCQMNDFCVDYNLQSSESDFTNIVLTPTSATNSLFRDWDFTTDPVEFDSSFALEYF